MKLLGRSGCCLKKGKDQLPAMPSRYVDVSRLKADGLLAQSSWG